VEQLKKLQLLDGETTFVFLILLLTVKPLNFAIQSINPSISIFVVVYSK